MLLPFLLLLLAFAAAAVASYGTDPAWISYSNGLEIIYMSRRLQGPLFTLCVILCFALLLLVVSGKRRAWWLIGLAPILVLFAHRFATSPMRDFKVADNPSFVAFDGAHQVRDEDYIVGLMYDGTAYAYPYAALYQTPVVIQTIVQERLILLWNPYANYARAFVADRGVTARELEVVSMPANALLLYNSRYGEFINGVTALNQNQKKPSGFGRELETYLSTFARWKQLHPNTKVLPAPSLGVAPPVPLKPRYVIPVPPRGQSATAQAADVPSPDASVVLIATTRPTALTPTDLPNTPVNLVVAGESIVAFRDPNTGNPRAFSRVLHTGEEVAFAPIPPHLSKLPTTRPTIHMFDNMMVYPWTASGRLLEVEPKAKPAWKGASLTPLITAEGPYYQVLRYWYPDLNFHHVTAADFATIASPVEPPPPPRPQRTPRRRR